MTAPTPETDVDPDLAARLAVVRAQEEARASLKAKVLRERRILIPMLGVVLLMWPNFGTVKVVGKSMQPTYHTGDTLIILKSYRWLSPLKVGDIVVVSMKHGKIKGEQIVKRVAFIQNAEATNHWPATIKTPRGPIPTGFLFHREAENRVTVPASHIMVLGDNVLNSMDSRDFGPVADYEILGKVILP